MADPIVDKIVAKLDDDDDDECPAGVETLVNRGCEPHDFPNGPGCTVHGPRT